jgi:hypothetical protein
MWAILTPAQRRAATGLPLDAKGVLLPPPGETPPNLTDDGLSFGDIVSRVAPLLWLLGDRGAEATVDPKAVAFPGFTDQAAVDRSVERARPDVSSPWRTKLRLIWQKMLDLPARIVDALRRGIAIPDVAKQLEKTFDDVANTVGQELQHEALRVKGEAEDEIGQSMDAAVYVGYTLHSRFAPNTAPDHAARDGYKYFRDDRPGSAAVWTQRIVPPYRKNCLCFTIPLLETPDGNVHSAEFGLRVSGGQTISVRDVGTWQTWFDQQQPWVQKKLVGEKRWFGVAGTGLGKPRWSDFVDRKGKIIPARKLATESPAARQQRARDVQRIIDEQARRYREAWERGGVKMTPADEAAYRRRLDAFLRRVLK